MVLDARGAEVSRQPVETAQDLLEVHGIRVHILLLGESFDLARRAVMGANSAPAAGR